MCFQVEEVGHVSTWKHNYYEAPNINYFVYILPIQ